MVNGVIPLGQSGNIRYIAKRAETYNVIRETVDGLIPLDFAGLGVSNIIASGVGEFVELAVPVPGGDIVLDITMKLVNGGTISGILNVAQEPGDGNVYRAFVSGVVGGTAGAIFVDYALGFSVELAFAGFIANSSAASGSALAGIGLVNGAATVVVGEVLTTIVKQGYATFITREFASNYLEKDDIYRIDTNWNLQDNLFGNFWQPVDYLQDLIFPGNPDDLRYIAETSNGFDLVGENTKLAYLTYRKIEKETGLNNVFAYGGSLEQAKTEVSIEKSSDIDAMIEFLGNKEFYLKDKNENSYEIKAFKYFDDPDELFQLAKTDQYVLDAIINLRKYAVINDPAINTAPATETAQLYSDQMLQDRVAMAIANAQYEDVINQAYGYIDYANKTYLYAKSFGENQYANPGRSFGGGNNIELVGSEFKDHLYGAINPNLTNYNDIIKGKGGDDYIEGGKGQDTMYGGKGEDTFFILGQDEDYDDFYGGEDNDRILGSQGDDTIRVHNFSKSSNSIETIDAGEGENDAIAGTDKDDFINLSGIAVDGVERLEGGDGSDTLIATDQNDTIYGGSKEKIEDMSQDRLEGGAGDDTYFVGIGDIIVDSDGDNTIWFNGQKLNDLQLTQAAKDSIHYESANGAYRGIKDEDTGSLTLVAEGTTSSITLEQFSSGNFGITLEEYTPPEKEFQSTLTGTPFRDEMGILAFGDNPENWRLVFTSFPEGSSFGTPFVNELLPLSPPSMEIHGNESGDFLFGFTGHDFIAGGDGSDIIIGDLGFWNGKALYAPWPVDGDLLDGGAGNDFIRGGGGKDMISGGTGNDIMQSYDGKDSLSGDAGNDVLAGGSHDDVLSGGDGDDALFGDGYFTGSITVSLDNIEQFKINYTYSGQGFATGYQSVNFGVQNDAPEYGNDFLSGGAGRDWLDGGMGSDVLSGGDDHDLLAGGGGDDLLEGGTGNDLLFGDHGDNVESAEDGADIIYGGDGEDYLYGLGGDDFLYGNSGKDILSGGSGADRLSGGEGDDVLFGDSGADLLYGDDGRDVLSGGAGNDTLIGGSGYDELAGGSGDDLYRFSLGDGYDIVEDGSGEDRIRFGGGITVQNLYVRTAHYEQSSGRVTFTPAGKELWVEYSNSDGVLIRNGAGGSNYMFEFADGSFFSQSQLLEMTDDTGAGTEPTDYLSPYQGGGNSSGSCGTTTSDEEYSSTGIIASVESLMPLGLDDLRMQVPLIDSL